MFQAVHKMKGFAINTSEWDFPNTLWIRHSNEEIIIKAVTLIPIVIFGVIGNLTLLYVIARNRSMRVCPTNILITNMAFADLATLLISPIMFLYHDSYQNYVLGPYGCHLEGFLQGAFLITDVINLCGISFDRLSAIVAPIGCRMTVKRAKIFVVMSWIGGFTLAIPLTYFRYFMVREWKNFTEKFCAENVVILTAYWHIIIATLVWIPLTIMIISYTAIFFKLNHYEKQLLKRETPLAVSHKKKVTKTLFIVLVTFILLRLPFTMLVFIRQQKLQHSEMNQFHGAYYILWYTSHYMIFVNAAVNPVIYGLMNGNIRRAWSKMNICKCKETQNEEKNQQNPRIVLYEEPLKMNLEPRDPCYENQRTFSLTDKKSVEDNSKF